MFISKQLTDTQRRYSTTEREALAIFTCLEEVRWLVIGSPYPTKVYTDHQALVSLLRQDDAHGRIAGWQVRLSEYDVEYIYVPGQDNTLADGMSRIPANAAKGEAFMVEVLQRSEALVQEWNGWIREDWYGAVVFFKVVGDFEG